MRIIRGKHGRRRFDVPTNIKARPTTDFARENLFNVLDNIVDFEGKRCLDLFAGTGAISYEFLSRGAAHVTAVEKASLQAGFISKVVRALGEEEHFTLIKGDALRFLASCTASYDIIFADPPYAMKGFGEVPTAIFESRAAAEAVIVVVEHNSDYDFSSLPGFRERRTYGSVNFSIFEIARAEEADDAI